MPFENLPDHAYLPGLNERHAEDTFDAIRQTAEPGLNAAGLARCDAFRVGLYLLKTNYCWEAHEVLEPVWMALPAGSAERQFVQGLIQLAIGRLKLNMGRPKAALRLVGLARGLVQSSAATVSQSGESGECITIMTLKVRDVNQQINSLQDDVMLVI